MRRLSYLLAVAAPLSLPAQQSLWSRVPAAPNSCYWDSTFASTLQTTKQALDAEIGRQQAINDSLAKLMHAGGGGGTAAAMQAAMMKDPAGAQKVLQEISEMGTEEYQNAQIRVLKKEADIEATFPAIDSAFQPAYQRATAPLWSAWRAQHPDGEGGRMPTPAEVTAFQKNMDDAYAPVCTQYYKPGGKYPVWLAAYKAYFVNEFIPQNDKVFTTTKDMLGFYGVPVTNYKNTTTMQAVSHFLDYAYKAAAKMPGKPKVN